MSILRRIVALAMLSPFLLAGCGTDVEITLSEPRLEPRDTNSAGASDPVANPTPTSTEAAPAVEVQGEATRAPLEIPTPTPDSSEAVDAASEASAPATPPGSLALLPLLFVVAPNAPLLGVGLGAEADPAIDRLVGFMGEPDQDSGWYEGCPLDGDADDERLLQWGDLNVYFVLADGLGRFTAWGYDLRTVAGGFPDVESVVLPGGAMLGDPMNEVAEAAGLDVVYDEAFDINRLGEPGFEIVSEAPPGAPTWGAFVPAVPICE